MKIVFYSQHVLGAGHFFRSLELARGLAPHPVHMVCGGTGVTAKLPDNVTYHALPELMMDREFTELRGDRPVGDIQEERKALLMKLMRQLEPDIFLVELFPFGRKRFGFELLPVLEALRKGGLKSCPAVCSVRDILVEKSDQKKYEIRVLNILNSLFSAVIVHSDPAFAKLEETFSRVQDIRIPMHYSGYITPKPRAGAGRVVRRELGMAPGESLVLASAGGGNVGGAFLRAVMEASAILAGTRKHRLVMFTGPFLPEEEFQELDILASGQKHVIMDRFTPDFLEHLDAADLSVSMAGYNTSMNLLSSGTYGLVHPFDQNREQAMRAERLEKLGVLGVLDNLDPGNLAYRMERALSQGRPPGHGLNLAGSAGSARILEDIFTSWQEDVHGGI